jgi:hypothetical protein
MGVDPVHRQAVRRHHPLPHHQPSGEAVNNVKLAGILLCALTFGGCDLQTYARKYQI